MPENDLPKEEKIITEQEFKKEIRKHLLVMEFNKDRLDNFSVLKKLLIITAPFAIAYAVYGYFLYSGFIIGFNLLFLISIIPFLVSLIFNLWILAWTRGRIIDVSLGLLHLIDYAMKNQEFVEWTAEGVINFDDIMRMGEETLGRKNSGAENKKAGKVC